MRRREEGTRYHRDEKHVRSRRSKRAGMSRSNQVNVSTDRSRSQSPNNKKSINEGDDIPGYEEMTPAERLRAKVKVLINKSDAKSTSDSRPNPVEVLELETDDFTPQSFMSKRTDRFTKEDNETASALVSHDNAIFGKRTLAQSEPLQSIPSIPLNVIEIPTVETSSVQSVDRAQLWAGKLKLLRKKYARILK